MDIRNLMREKMVLEMAAERIGMLVEMFFERERLAAENRSLKEKLPKEDTPS